MLKEALNEENVDMPYPTQVVLFHDQTEEIDGNREMQREGWSAGKKPPKSKFEMMRGIDADFKEYESE